MTNKMEYFEGKLKEKQYTLTKKKAAMEFYQEELKQLTQDLITKEKNKDLLDKVKLLFQISSEHARNQAKSQLEMLVTNTLQFVFGPSFKFEIDISNHGGNPVANFFISTEHDSKIIRNDPQDSRGGGIVDVVSLALRVSFMESIHPKLLGPIILDEPGKHVSEDYIISLIEFLRSITTSFNRQIILVTHNADLVESSDLAYNVSISKGVSEIGKL